MLEENVSIRKKHRFLKGILCVTLVVLLILALLCGPYLYGRCLIKKRQYDDALKIFSRYPQVLDVPELIRQAQYGIACNLMEDQEYLPAAEAFAQMQDYRDSKENMSYCYYTLGTEERLAGDHLQAKEYYELAGEYKDAKMQAGRMVYQLGHQAFLGDDYDTANRWFALLERPITEYGYIHFETMLDAAGYLQEQLELQNNIFSFCLGEEWNDESFLQFENLLMCQYSSPAYFGKEKLITVGRLFYYPGDVILDAWENGDTSKLSEDELLVLEKALEITRQAQVETETDLELEIWLHDWLCKQVVYESPDMDVRMEKYVQLRELSCIGAILDGYANCQGYSDAFYLLANMAGLQVSRLKGDAGGGHIWNMICIDGLWYLIDVTFDDLSDQSIDAWTYTYFNIPLGETHSVYGGREVMPDLAKVFNADVTYFGKHDGIFTDEDAAAEYLVEQFRQDRNWTYAMVLAQELTVDEMNDTLKQELENRGIYTAWSILVENHAGDTYISIFWE